MGFTEKRFGIERFNRLPEEALADIVRASWEHWHKLGMCDEKSPEEWREYLRKEDREKPVLHFGVTWNGQVVGMASVVEKDSPSVDKKYTPWLANLFIMPAFRGKGLAHLLRGQRLTALKQLGFSEVYVLAAPNTEGLHIKGGFDMVEPNQRIMRKDLRK